MDAGLEGVARPTADALLQGCSRPALRRKAHADCIAVAACRNYTVVNTEKGLLEVQHMSCAGMKLSCQLKIQNSLWTATEVTTPLQGSNGGVKLLPLGGQV